MDSNKIKLIIIYITSLIIILINIILFFPLTFRIIIESGGPMGYGLLILPFLIIFHLLIIPVIISLSKGNKSSNSLIIFNSIVCLIVITIYFNLFNLLD
jgi:hypothetical protein